MALTIIRGLLPGFKDLLKSNLNAAQREGKKLAKDAKYLFDEYVEDVKNLKYTLPEFIESYKEDLRAMGINNAGDFAKWTLKCIGVTAFVVLGGKVLSIVFGSGFAGGLIGGVGSFAVNTLGLMSAITLQPVVTPLLQLGIQTTGQVLNFNINQTDEELWKELENKVNGMYGLLGTTVGSALGWLVCGALPNSVAFRFNKAVAVAIAQDLNEEARQELYAYIGQIVRLSAQTLLNSELINRFTSLRRELKRNPESEFSKFVRRTIGEDRFKKWGDANQEAWTIKKNIIDASIAKEQDPQWKQFYENTLEGFTDSCMEASFMIANNMDTYIASQKIARSNMLGRVQTVRIRINEGFRAATTPT
ncbi:hypothetical protein NIES4101_46230 [Calothrix sp. NIES-4101]|nr:hypothetical protein NIES4101_46230 [Calothrix sp. NIES-4101]